MGHTQEHRLIVQMRNRNMDNWGATILYHLSPFTRLLYWCLQKRISIIFWMCIEGLHNILENNFKILTTLLKCIYKFKYLIFHNNRMSKLLWKLCISYRIEEPLEHCMSIQAKNILWRKLIFKGLFFKVVWYY